jgi:hypothetical protein
MGKNLRNFIFSRRHYRESFGEKWEKFVKDIINDFHINNFRTGVPQKTLLQYFLH